MYIEVKKKKKKKGTLPLFEKWAELDDKFVVCPLKNSDKEESINIDLEYYTDREIKLLNGLLWLLDKKNT